MTALQNIMSKLGLGDAAKTPPAANDRRAQPDRRRSDSHDNVFLLHGTESRLQFAARVIGFGTYDLDSATGEINFSSELKAVAGLPPDAAPFPLERFAELIHPDDRERFMAGFAAALDPHNRSAELDEVCRLLRPDGTQRQVRVRGRSLFFGHGNTRRLLGATGVVVDITDSQASEQRLQVQAGLVDLAPDPILAWDQRHGIVLWNKACEQVFGYSREEALGKPCHELLKAEFPVSRQACLAELARNGRWSGEIRYTARDGRAVAVESRLERIKHDGQVSILEADRCLTDRTAALVESNEALARSNLELEHFAHVAAHDLQAPLRTIAAYAQMLQRDYQDRLNERGLSWMERILYSAHRMQALIRDLLAYARFDSGPRAFEPIDFSRLVDGVLPTLDAAIRESGAEVSRDELPVVMGNPTQLAQVLQNLVGNSIKYRGEEPPRIHVSARREGDEWLFSVRDNGIGMAGQDLERIFDIFHRLHTQEEYPGSGIGLAVCRRFIQLHGGRIWAESEAGHGSVFHFTLPAAAG